MFATALTTMTSFQMILLCENDIPLLRVVVISFFSGYVSVVVHHQQNNEIVR